MASRKKTLQPPRKTERIAGWPMHIAISPHFEGESAWDGTKQTATPFSDTEIQRFLNTCEAAQVSLENNLVPPQSERRDSRDMAARMGLPQRQYVTGIARRGDWTMSVSHHPGGVVSSRDGLWSGVIYVDRVVSQSKQNANEILVFLPGLEAESSAPTLVGSGDWTRYGSIPGGFKYKLPALPEESPVKNPRRQRKNPNVGEHPDFFGFGDTDAWQADEDVSEPWSTAVHVPLDQMTGRELARVRWFMDLNDAERVALAAKYKKLHTQLMTTRTTDYEHTFGESPAKAKRFLELVDKMKANDDASRAARLSSVKRALLKMLERRRERAMTTRERDDDIVDDFQRFLSEKADVALDFVDPNFAHTLDCPCARCTGGLLNLCVARFSSTAQDALKEVRSTGPEAITEMVEYLKDPAIWLCTGAPEYAIWTYQPEDDDLGGTTLGQLCVDAGFRAGNDTPFYSFHDEPAEFMRDIEFLREAAAEDGFEVRLGSEDDRFDEVLGVGRESTQREMRSLAFADDCEQQVKGALDRQGMDSTRWPTRAHWTDWSADTLRLWDNAPNEVGFVLKDVPELVETAKNIVKGVKADAAGGEPEVVYRFTGKNDTPAGASAKGMYVVELTTKSQLRKEGATQGICIGNPEYGHPQMLLNGETRVFSLRTESGKPKFTIELKDEGDTEGSFARMPQSTHTGRIGGDVNWSIAEVKGKANRLPGFEPGKREMTKPDEVRALCEFFLALGFTKGHIGMTSDMFGGVQAMLDAGVSPFEPPPVKKRAPRENPASSEGPYPVSKQLAKHVREAYNSPMGGVWGTG